MNMQHNGPMIIRPMPDGSSLHMHTDTMVEVEFVRGHGANALVATLPTSALRTLSEADTLSVQPED